MEHPNATRQREVNDAFRRGDLETVRNYWADDCVWHHGGRGPLAGTYHRWDDFVAYLQRFLELTGGTFTDEIVDILADDRHAVTVFEMHVGRRRDAEVFDTTFTYAAKLDAEGKQVEGWFLTSDQAGWDEFWS
jgi:ketosteroid isomerase-like protein